MHQTQITQEARRTLILQLKGFISYCETFTDFKNWIDAVYNDSKSIEHVKVSAPNDPVIRQTINENQFQKDHLIILKNKGKFGINFEITALAVTLMAGPSSKYLLYIIKKMYKTGLLSEPSSLFTAIHASMTLQDYEKKCIDGVGNEQQSANLTALIKSYPVAFCHSTLDITCIATAIPSCKEVLIAANITITFDQTTLRSHVKRQEERNIFLFTDGRNYAPESIIQNQHTMHMIENIQNAQDVKNIIQMIRSAQPQQPVDPLKQAIEFKLQDIKAQPAQLQEACAAKELYINSYISYFLRCHHIMSRWTPIESTPLQQTNNGERPKIPSECIMHILSFIDSMPTPCTKIANGIIHKSERLRIGGELHNIMVTSTISKWYASSELKPSIENSARWECIKFALNEKINDKNKNTNVSMGTNQ